MIRLYSYWRSSAAYRVRIALALKGVDYETVAVHLVRDGGEQLKPGYRALNPQGRVPLIEHESIVISQSLAIIEYLDEVFREPPLLPGDAAARARVRSLAQLIACDIHPLNNLGVLKYLKAHFAADESNVQDWYRHWIAQGFKALETRLEKEADTGVFCHGDRPTLADLCLVPQVYNAHRYSMSMQEFPRIAAIAEAAAELPAFQQAAPEQQPDAE